MRRRPVTLLSLNDVTLRYPGETEPVLSNVSLDLYLGATVCFTGPSGSGKSTLLSLLGGLVKPTHGSVMFEGHDIWRSRKARQHLHREIAWVLQSANVVPPMPSILNAALAAVIRGMDPVTAQAGAGAELRRLGLAPIMGKVTKLLSGGQIQRVTVARALASGAPIILADEPTGQLDREGTEVVAKALSSHAVSDRLTVLASHDEAVASECDLVYIVADTGISRA